MPPPPPRPPRRVALMPAGVDPQITTAEWIRAVENDPSYCVSDVDTINTTSEWSNSPGEFCFDRRSSSDFPTAATFEEARRWQRSVPRARVNPFVDTDEEIAGSEERGREERGSQERDEGRVRVLNFEHLPPHYRPTLTLVLPENLPHLQQGQVLVIPLRMTIQRAHPDDVADL